MFVTFSRWENGKRLPTSGSLNPLRDFLLPKIKKLVLVDQPHPGSDRVMPKIEEYNGDKENFKSHESSWYVRLLRSYLESSRSQKTQIRFKLRDFLSVIDWSLRDKTKFDYAVCLESINTLAAILLRKLGRVKKVIYYVSDYSPNRYPSKWFNFVYLALDRFCAEHADYIWDVSPAMQKARISAGLDPEKSAPVIDVPNGLLPAQIKAAPISSIDKHAIVYMGTLGAENGPDIPIKALSIILDKFKDTKLHIIGGTNEDFLWLKKIITKMKLGKSIIRHGFIEDELAMSRVISHCAVGLAPYRNIPGSIRQYADAGKIRAYCAAGIPVVTSRVPPLGHVVADKGAAIVVDDDPAAFAQAIINIFSNQKLYMTLRQNAIKFGQDNTWENSFRNAFASMGKVTK